MSVRHLTATVAATLLLATAPATPALAEGTAPDQSRDAAFLRAAHQGNLAEIAAGRDAQRHAASACVKKVGRTLVRDHRRLDRQGGRVARQLGVSLPSTPSPEQRQALARVRAQAGGPAYDRAWAQAQARAHRHTLRLIDRELASGDDPRVKAVAKAARPVVARHLDMVRDGVCRA